MIFANFIIDSHIVIVYYCASTQVRVMCTIPITGGGIMDYKANIPIYLQVIDDIKKRILTGEIKLGDKLP